jgi:hypothetical protein
MDDNNGNPQENSAAENISTEGHGVLGAQGQEANTGHPNRSGDKPTYKQRIAVWFRGHFSGHRPLEWLTFAFEVLAFIALCIYSGFSYEQWQAIRDQKTVMQGQLDQMKGSSAQTERLITETHTFVSNHLKT